MLRAAKSVLFVLLILALCWALLTSFTLANAIMVLRNWRGYREATFVVAEVKYSESYGGGGAGAGGGGGSGTLAVDYWAKGTIHGARERYSLKREVAHSPKSQDDLERMVPPGDQFRVWYNPGMSHAIIQGETLRVLPQRSHPKHGSIRYLVAYACLCLLPVIVFGIGFGVSCHCVKRAKRRELSA